jgi:hypothetical protein
LFDGFACRPILDEYVLPTPPHETYAHAAYDGRWLYFATPDDNCPFLVADFMRYPQSPPRAVVSGKSYSASYFDRLTGKLYLADTQYVYQGANSDASVAVALRTAELIPEDLAVLGDMGMMVMHVNTQGGSLIVTPRANGVAGKALSPVITSSLQYKEVPISFKDVYSLSFDMAITSTKDVVIESPIMLRKE